MANLTGARDGMRASVARTVVAEGEATGGRVTPLALNGHQLNMPAQAGQEKK
jgi:hypothetical protein